MESNSFTFVCPCGARLSAPSAFEGQRMRCPSCREIVRAERSRTASPPVIDREQAYELVDPAPAVDPDRAVPFTPSPAAHDLPFRLSFFGRVYGDFMLPVAITWLALLAWWAWTGDDHGELPARVLFVASVFATFFAGLRIPRHLDTGFTDSLL